MPSHRRVTQLHERIEIMERSQAGQSDKEIAAAMGWSWETVRKWRRKGQREGRHGLAPKLGRPATGALSSFGSSIQTEIETLRRTHPGWGPETLRLELRKDPQFATTTLPSRSRIAAFLKDRDFVRPYARHTELAQPPATAPTVPHEEWELDAQGVQTVTGIGAVAVINLADGYSRLRVESWGCQGRSKASTEDYQLACRRGFMRYGLPRRISLDHDTVFFDSNNASPFPSRFHLWLLSLGVEVRFISQPPPNEHAVVERTHHLLSQQALVGQSFTTASQMQTRLDERCAFLNSEYPSRTWHGHPPLAVHPLAHHSCRSYTPETEAAQMDLQRVYHYLAQHRWFRHVSAQGQFTLGGYRYGLGSTWVRQTIEIHFDPQTVELMCISADGQRSQRKAAQGLSKADLMGELPPWDNLPAYQRHLPFSFPALREDALFQEMAGTIL